MTPLQKQLTEALAFNKDQHKRFSVHWRRGASAENARLSPIHQALIEMAVLVQGAQHSWIAKNQGRYVYLLGSVETEAALAKLTQALKAMGEG